MNSGMRMKLLEELQNLMTILKDEGDEKPSEGAVEVTKVEGDPDKVAEAVEDVASDEMEMDLDSASTEKDLDKLKGC